MKLDGSSGDGGSGCVGDRTRHLGVRVERAAIVFDLEIEQAASVGLVDNVSGTFLDVRDKVVTVVELSVWSSTSDAVVMVSALVLVPAGRFETETGVPRITRMRAV